MLFNLACLGGYAGIKGQLHVWKAVPYFKLSGPTLIPERTEQAK
jgi:hypothetical protein